MNLESLRSGPVFLTGHTGFKGTWLMLLLERLGIEVIGYSLNPEEESLYNRTVRRGKIHETFGDLGDFSQLREAIVSAAPKYVLHLAAQALVTVSYNKPLETFETNVMGTANLLEACRGVTSIEKIGVVTTDKVYENSGLGRAFKENDPLGADDPYSSSKVAVESVIRAWRTLYSNQNNVQITSLRAGNVIGGGDYASNRLLPDIIKSKYESNEITIRYPDSTRPWQHALDPLIGYLSALTFDGIGATNKFNEFNFGPDSESLSVREVIKIAEQYWSKSLKINQATPNSFKYEASRLDLDSSRSHQVLGWSPTWNQEESVIRTLSWWDSVLSGSSTAFEACQRDIDLALSVRGLEKL